MLPDKLIQSKIEIHFQLLQKKKNVLTGRVGMRNSIWISKDEPPEEEEAVAFLRVLDVLRAVG